MHAGSDQETISLVCSGLTPPASDGTAPRLTQAELAAIWRISPRTLERWRWLKRGPAFVKAGGRVLYRLEDVTAYEAAQRRPGGAA
jgi:hypothetical protein